MLSLRLSLCSAVLATPLILAATVADAAWCAQMQGGSLNCGFQTFSQCQATISGIGGMCRESAYPSAGSRAAPQAARRAEKTRETRSERLRRALEERRQAKRAREAARTQRLGRRPPAMERGPTEPAVAMQTVAITDLNVDAVPALGREGIRRVQQVLKEKGFDPGPLNGVIGPRMTDAVRSFQDRFGMKAHGQIDNQTLLALGEAELASQSAR